MDQNECVAQPMIHLVGLTDQVTSERYMDGCPADSDLRKGLRPTNSIHYGPYWILFLPHRKRRILISWYGVSHSQLEQGRYALLGISTRRFRENFGRLIFSCLPHKKQIHKEINNLYQSRQRSLRRYSTGTLIVLLRSLDAKDAAKNSRQNGYPIDGISVLSHGVPVTILIGSIMYLVLAIVFGLVFCMVAKEMDR